MRAGLDRLAAGIGDEGDLRRLRELAEVVQVASLCGLGQAAPLSLRAALDHFPHAFARSRDA